MPADESPPLLKLAGTIVALVQLSKRCIPYRLTPVKGGFHEITAPRSARRHLILGLDIGAASIGWALVERTDGKPDKLRTLGVRAFSPGVSEDITAIRAGRDSSPAVPRREARLRRRQLARRRHRLTKLTHILQEAGLLPPGQIESGDDLMAYFIELDRELFSQDARRAEPHLLPYALRARALDERLTPHEFGRALYHLAQRRGFLSNRKVKPKPAGAPQTDEEKEEGKVKTAIGELAQKMQESGARSLGEYLSKLDPEDKRVRNRYLGRQMLIDEFEKIWTAQVAHHPDILTDSLRDAAREAIFFQRPLKSQRHLIGACDHEKRARRAPLASLVAQRFRLLQKVNDLKISLPDGRVRKLTPEERAKLIDALERQGDLKFSKIRSLLQLPKKNCHFNFETEGEKGLIGNRTASKLAAVFGDQRWTEFPEKERSRVVDEMRSIHNRDALKRRAAMLWNLDDEAAQKLSEVPLEEGYSNLSRKALAKLLPLMEESMPYASARKEIYGDEPGPQIRPDLPRLDTVLDVRNPTVQRALTELRKVVNAILRQHGRPDEVRIELAREMKKNRKDRKRIHANNTANREARESAAQEIQREIGIANPTRNDELKLLLAEECGWACPYTGKTISWDALFGDHPQFDIEHIIPFSRSLDNSFMNKTLCDAEENRSHKHNNTPREAYGNRPERWQGILDRVKKFPGHSGRVKLQKFQMEDLAALDDFTTQQLNDTRYASRLAIEYIGLLYGAGASGVDAEGRRRVHAGRGALTSFLRGRWGLNSILGAGQKTRDDHRQHAIDAVITALTDPATIKRLSDAAQKAPLEKNALFAEMPPPWEGFLDDVRAAIHDTTVSHRVSRKVAAALHEQTIYSKRHPDENGKECVHIRKPLQDLSPKDIDAIVDPAVRECVRDKLAELGHTAPKKAFTDRGNHPTLRAKDGREIPIHKVRIRKSETTKRIGGDGARARNVKLGSNHHVEIIETTDKKGRKRWRGEVVSTLEAARRLRARQAIVERDHGPDEEFKFSLAGGEIIELNSTETKEETKKEKPGTSKDRGRALYVIRTISITNSGRVTVDFAHINDARKKDDIRKAGDWGRSDIDPLRRRGCRKMLVTPSGEIRRAND